MLCKLAFPGAVPLTTIQVQAFEGLVIIMHTIADNIDNQRDACPFGSYPVDITEHRPFWEEKSKDDLIAD